MTHEQQKLERQKYIQAMLEKYTKEEPRLDLKEICEPIVWVLDDIRPILKQIAKELKK